MEEGTAMLKFEHESDFVEIDLTKQETDDVPSQGDAFLAMRVSSAGFTGQNDLWVLAAGLRSFCRALVILEQERRGEAVL
jgi:hypothetical protein